MKPKKAVGVSYIKGKEYSKFYREQAYAQVQRWKGIKNKVHVNWREREREMEMR